MRIPLILLAFSFCGAAALPAAAQIATTPKPAPPPPGSLVVPPLPGTLEPQRPAPPPPTMPPSTQRPTPPPPAMVPPVERSGVKGSLKNIKLDITISDSVASGGPTKKTVTLLLMSGRNGQIRSTGTGNRGVINVDAHPTEMPEERIALNITLEYLPDGPTPDSAGPPGILNQSLTVLLDSGKPTVITQSADPRTERRVTVEVTATMLK